MKAILIVAAGAAALLAGGCTTPMAEDMAPPPMDMAAGSMPTRAPDYMAMAHSSDMFEIESSRMAMERSQNPAVRQFAQMLINDHTRLSSEMMTLARTMNLPMPPMEMMPHHREMMQRLAAAAPGEFDMGYKREQIMAHEEAVGLHRTFAERGDHAGLRAAAARAAPVVEMHLAEAQRLPDHSAAAPMTTTPPPYTPPPGPVSTRRRGERG